MVFPRPSSASLVSMQTPPETLDEKESDTLRSGPGEPALIQEAPPGDIPATVSATVPKAVLVFERLVQSLQVPKKDARDATEGSTPATDPVEQAAVSKRSPEDMLADLKNMMIQARENLARQEQNAEAPTAALGSYLANPSANGPLYNVKNANIKTLTKFLGLLDHVSEAFSALDALGAIPSDPTSLLENDLSRSPTISSDAPASSSSSANSPGVEENMPNIQYLLSYIHKISKAAPNMFGPMTRRFFQTDELTLRSGLQNLRRHLHTLPENHSTYPFTLAMMGIFLLYLYEVTWENTTLEVGTVVNSIALTKWANLPTFSYTMIKTGITVFRSWAYGLRLIARRDDDVDKIEIALASLRPVWSIYRDAEDIEKITKQSFREELAMCLLEHYRLAGILGDLDESIEHLRALLEDSDRKAYEGTALGLAYFSRFLHCGEIEDLDRALHLGQIHSGSIQSRSYDSDKAASQYLFAITLAERFKMTMDTHDLDRAVQHCRNALALIHPSHPLLMSYRSSLASILYTRYEAQRSSGDIRSALEAIQSAAPEGTTHNLGRHHYISADAIQGYLLSVSGEESGNISTIENGVRQISRSRRDFSGPLHLESHIESYLSKAFVCLFRAKKDKDDFAAAIHHASLAFDKAPNESPYRFQYGLDLGKLLLQQYQFNHSSHCDDALALFCFVAMSPTRPSIRLEAALQWAYAAEAFDQESQGALDALAMALDIIPLVASLEHRMSVQYKVLSSQKSSIPTKAATYALDSGDITGSIRYLEKGRNILWAQALHLRAGHMLSGGEERQREFKLLSVHLSKMRHAQSPFIPTSMEELEERKRHLPPDLFNTIKPEHLDLLRKNVEIIREASSRQIQLVGAKKFDEFFTKSIEEPKKEWWNLFVDASLHNSAKRWNDLLPTFPTLQKPLFFSDEQRGDLMHIVTKGSIVIVNAHGFRCDAITISARVEDIDVSFTHLRLPDMSGDEIQAWAETLRQGMNSFQAGDIPLLQYENEYLHPILRGLWKGLACPILDHLRQIGDVRRVWWYPTGPLAFLPIHAASPCEEDKLGLLDLLVSSYTPSIQSLIRASKSPQLPLKVLAVGQSNTPGLSPLKYVDKEMKELTKQFRGSPESLTTLIGEEAAIYSVFSSLPDYTGLHFSCHAYQDEEYPFNSAFFLHNGPLRLSKLLDVDLSRVQFAFLSACLTSAGDISLPDECIHLAAGMQFAGVRSVIATMSSVGDRIAAAMASKVYGYLLRNGVENVDPKEAAEALHEAIKETRKRKIPLAYVVPYIHLGI